ncbi:MAG: TRAP transporter substrate-binding protein DctP [Aristaeellaceae bacterium]
MKKFLAILMAAVMLLAVASVGVAEEPTYAKSSEYDASGDAPFTLYFTSVSVTGDSHTTAMYAFKEAVEALSGGSLTCNVYADGTGSSSEGELDDLKTGSMMGGMDIAYISFPTLSTQAGLEWMAMMNSGYFWADYDHMTSTLNDSEIGTQIFAEIQEKTGLVPMCAMYLGSRCINTRAKEINSYADMAGVMLRMPGSEAWQNLGRALGAEPTSIAFSELYTALSTGACDGQDNPLPSDISAKFYEVAPYIAITNHVVDSIIPCINGDTWNTLTEAQQAAVKDAMTYAKEVNDTLRIESESEAVAYLEEQGCTITYPDLGEFRANVQQYYADHPEQTASWNMEVYDAVQALAE